MSEQRNVQPPEGSAVAEGVTLKWRLQGQALSYRISYTAPNSCYSAGAVQSVVTPSSANGPNIVVLKARVAYQAAICAQVLTDIVFEGQVAEPGKAFSVRAEVFNEDTRKLTVIE